MFKIKYDPAYFHSVKWGTASIVISVFRQLLLVPAFIVTVGQEGYNLWILLYNVSMLICALSTGFLHFSSNLVNISFHKGENMSALVSNIARAAFCIVAFQVATGAAVVYMLPLSYVLSLSDDFINVHHVALCLVLLLLARSFYQYTASFLLRLFEPEGNIPKTLKYQFFLEFLDLLVTCIAIVLSHSILITCISVLCIHALMFLLSLIYSYKEVKFLHSKQGSVSWTVWLILKKSSVLNLGFGLEKIYDNGLNLVVQARYGAVATTVFSTLRTLANLFYRFTYTGMLPFFPAIQKEFAKGNMGYVKELTYKYWKISLLVMMLVIAVGLPILPYFYEKWTKGALSFNLLLLCFLFVGAMFQNYVFVITEFFKKTNFSIDLIRYNVVRVVVAVGVLYGLSFLKWSPAIGLSLAGAEFFAALLVSFIFKKKILAISGQYTNIIAILLFASLLVGYAAISSGVFFVLMIFFAVVNFYREKIFK